MINTPYRIWFPVIVFMGVFVVSATAQTGAGLVLRPWPEGVEKQLRVDVLTLNQGRIENTGGGFRLRRHDASGRWRDSADGGGRGLTVGFDAGYLDISSNNAVLPKRLVDQSVAAGFRLDEGGKGDSVWLVLGVGYAGSNPFGDVDAVYGKADLIFNRSIDRQSSWRVVVNYDGNRVVFPDIPLPAIAYHYQSSAAFGYTLGLPMSSFVWKPDDRWIVRVTYGAPVTVNARIEYRLFKGCQLYGSFENHLDAFTVDGAREHQRIFFQQRRVEAGARLRFDGEVELLLAGGYAFGQEFSTGFDARDLEDIADTTDEPYLRVGLNLSF